MLIYRRQATQLIQNVILGFALSVVAIRAYLAFAPMKVWYVGNFHVAHMLYGGIFLFVALLLIFTFQNSRILKLASWLTGIGFGFFIDEIGKYVSINNDYYYKLAAPIIYIVFLLVVTFFLFVKRQSTFDLQEEVFHVLYDLQILLENNLGKSGYTQLKKTLERIQRHPENRLYSQLMKSLDSFITDQRENFTLHPNRHQLFFMQFFKQHSNQVESYRLTKIIFFILFGIRLFWVIPSISLPLIGLTTDVSWQEVRQTLIESSLITGSKEFWPFIFTSVLEVGVIAGLLTLFPLVLVGSSRGMRMTRNVLLFSVLFLGVFNFYFGQFSALIAIMLDTVLLLLITHLRKVKYFLLQEKVKKYVRT